MGVPTSEVGYTFATTRRENHESSYENVVTFGGGECIVIGVGYEEMLEKFLVFILQEKSPEDVIVSQDLASTFAFRIQFGNF